MQDNAPSKLNIVFFAMKGFKDYEMKRMELQPFPYMNKTENILSIIKNYVHENGKQYSNKEEKFFSEVTSNQQKN